MKTNETFEALPENPVVARLRGSGGSLVAPFACLAVVLAFVGLFGACGIAFGDEVSDAQDALSEAESQLTELQAERDELEASIASLQDEIDSVAAQAMAAQLASQQSLDRLKNSAVFHYKLGGVTLYDMVLSSESLADMLATVNYLDALEASFAKDAQEQQDLTAALESTIKGLDQKKAEQNALRDELAAKEAEAQTLVEEATARVDEAKEQERLAALAALAAPSGSVFETGAIDGSWQLGFASAYSFEDNDGWDATASGIPLDWTSYTVAVPISQRYLLGSSVEISYGGMSLVATVTDVGGFAGYGRALDLAPGVWKAFGASSPGDWGVRQVAYRFL